MQQKMNRIFYLVMLAGEGLADAFDESKSNWANEYLELKSLLSEEEYKSARESTLTSFYTSPVVIESIYKALNNLGFRHGNILEPSCGIGNFFGMLPDEMKGSKMYGVELIRSVVVLQNSFIKIQILQ